MERIKIVLCARSKRNGIEFYSNVCPFIGVDSSLDSNGVIQTRILFRSTMDFMDTVSGQIPTPHTGAKILTIFLSLLLMCIAIFFGDILHIIGALYFSILVLKPLLDFIFLIFDQKFGQEKSISRFHAAEHMAINAYAKFQRVPTIDEVLKSSRFEKDCGSRIGFNSIIINSFIAFDTAFILENHPQLSIALAFIVPTLVFLADRIGLLKFLQIFVTSKPTQVELSVAVAGIKVFDFLEESLNLPDDDCNSSESNEPL